MGKRLLLLLLAGLLFLTPYAYAEPEEEEESNSVLSEILLYLPNRVFDFTDIFRLRARVGPGFAVGARATELVSIYAGTYATVFAGLPGPRMKTGVPIPIGMESHNGVTVSVADATADGGIGPEYSPSEIGAGFQLAIIGLDFGVDPLELVDFLAGIFLIDMQGDDF